MSEKSIDERYVMHLIQSIKKLEAENERLRQALTNIRGARNMAHAYQLAVEATRGDK